MKNTSLRAPEALRGFKYLYGKDFDLTKKVMQKCGKFLENSNFEEIVTPFLVEHSIIVGEENRPVSIAKSEIVFNFLTINGEKVAMRYENTLPVCKFYVDNFATRKTSPLKKLYYISPQFRNEKEIDLNGRLRQFYQVGWEVIGGKKTTHIYDAIKVGDDILKGLHLKHSVRISEVNILGEVFDALKLTRKDRHNLIEIYDGGNADELAHYIKRLQLNSIQKELLVELITSKGAGDIKIKKLRLLLLRIGCKTSIKRIDKVKKTFVKLKKLGCKDAVMDFSFVRSNKFYSGIIFQYYVGGNNHECGGGGEYDRIVKSLGGPSTLSCGAAFGLERVIYEYSKNKRN